jgi:NTE family protein
MLGDRTFADLPIPYACVAFDLETCQPVVLREGRRATAVRASCSIPGVVTPVEWDGHLLVDGWGVNNLPISAARELGADEVIAVSLHAPLGRRPGGIEEIALVTLKAAITRASDDPATADVYIPVPLTGLSSLVRVSQAMRMVEAGRQAAERAMPAIRAATRGGG